MERCLEKQQLTCFLEFQLQLCHLPWARDLIFSVTQLCQLENGNNNSSCYIYRVVLRVKRMTLFCCFIFFLGQHMADVANRTQLPGAGGELTFIDLLGTRPRAKSFFKNYFILFFGHATWHAGS